MTERTKQNPSAAESAGARAAADEPRKTYRTISISVLIGTLVVVAAVAGGLHFWHGFQLRRGAARLLAHAEELVLEADADKQNKAYSEAASLIYRYTQIQPDDTDAQIRLAEVYQKGAQDERSTDRAITLLYEALGVADAAKQNQLRRSLIELLLSRQEFMEAETESRKLAGSATGGELDFDVARLRALALFGRYRTEQIAPADVADAVRALVDNLRAAIAQQPDPELVGIFAFLLRSDDPQIVIAPENAVNAPAGPAPVADGLVSAAPEPLTAFERAEEADRLVNELVRQRPDDAQAWLVRFNYRKGNGLPGSDEDLAEALDRGGDNLAVRLTAGAHAYDESFRVRRQYGLSFLPTSPDDVPGLTPEQRAAVDQARGLLQQASDHYQYVLDHIDAKNESALMGVGRAAINLNEPQKAVDLWTHALEENESDSLSIRYYLTEVLLNMNQFAAARPHLAALEQLIANLNLGGDRNQFHPLRRSVELMRAKGLVDEERFAEALPLAERASAGQPATGFEASVHFQAQQLAALCHEQAGRPDLAAQCLRKAAGLATDPDAEATALVRAAAIWDAAGATANAIADCERSLRVRPSTDAAILLAQLLLTRQRTLPADERNWSRFEEALEQFRRPAGGGEPAGAWRADFLEAEANLLRAATEEETAQARDSFFQVARAAEERFPEDQLLSRRLVLLYQRLGHPGDADRALAQFQRQATDAVASALLAANLQFERGDFEAALATLEQAGDQLRPVDRNLVGKMKAQIAIAAGRPADAAEILKRLAQDFPGDLSIAQLRMQVLGQMNDTAALQELEAELLGGSQEDKSWALVMKIERLVAAAASAQDAGFLEAVDMLRRLETARPGWSTTCVLRGLVEEKRASLAADDEQRTSLLGEAVRAYQQAIELGERTTGVKERLLTALYRLGRVQDASRILASMDAAVPLSGTLSEMAINLAMQEGEKERALDVARRAVESRPDDVMAHVWYGMALLGSGRTAEAEQVLRDAVTAAPQDEGAWNGLFTFYVRTDNKAKAREALAQMVDQANIPADRRPYMLAQGYESLEDHASAEAAYQEALQVAPDNDRVRLRLAQFYLARLEAEPDAGYQPKAIAVLQEIVRRHPNDGQARRTLAMLLAGEGGTEWQAALEMLNATGGRDASSATDRRLQGMLLFQRDGDENLAQARQIFETLVGSREAEPYDRVLLAKILERQGDAAGARELYARVAALVPPDAFALTSYVDFLLRQGDRDESRRWLQVLVDTRKQAFDLELLELQGRQLMAEGKADQVPGVVDPPSLERFSSLTGQEAAVRATLANDVGDVYTRLELPAAAEPWYRRAMELEPTRVRPLATSLAQQGRMNEALDICESAVGRVDIAALSQVVANVLNQGKPVSADYERAAPLLATIEQQGGGDAGVLLRLANIRFVQGKSDEVVRLLEASLVLDPKNVVTLNNLAMMLSERPETRGKAIEYIDRAIDLVGPRPSLCDTKASIYLYDRRPAEALPLLEFAVRASDREAQFLFHLAAAYFGVDRKPDAAQYLQRALDAGLDVSTLTPADQQLLSLMQDLLPAS